MEPMSSTVISLYHKEIPFMSQTPEERAAKFADSAYRGRKEFRSSLALIILEAVEEEREACAQIASAENVLAATGLVRDASAVTYRIEKAIRARSQEATPQESSCGVDVADEGEA
jgi:hypothetical protein